MGRGGRNEGGGRREKCSSCTLSFQGAKNFIPGRACLSLSLTRSLWKILQALDSSQLPFTHVHFHTRLTCEDRRTILHFFSFLGFSGQKTTTRKKKKIRPDRSRRERWGGRGHNGEEVASPGMHGSRHDQTRTVALLLFQGFFFLAYLLLCLFTSSFLPCCFYFILSVLPPFLLGSVHARLSEGIEFISQFLAWHTTTSTGGAHAHKRRTNVRLKYLVPKESNRARLSLCFMAKNSFGWKKRRNGEEKRERETGTNERTQTVPRGTTFL